MPQLLANHYNRASYSSKLSVWRFVIAIAFSLVATLLLELGTLFGAPVSQASHPQDWKLVRIFLYFFICLIPSLTIAQYGLLRLLRRLYERISISTIKAFALTFAVAVLCIICGVFVGGLIASGLGKANDWRYAVFISAILLMPAFLFINRQTIRKHAEWGFLGIGLISGVVMCLFMPIPPETIWDGQIHFNNATALSYIVDAEYSEADVIVIPINGEQGGLFRLGLVRSVEELDVELESRTLVFFYPDQRIDMVNRAREILEREEAAQPTTLVHGIERLGGASYLSIRSFGVIPNAMGLWIGRLLHLGPVERLLCGRLANLLTYLLVFFFGIRRLKSGKLIASAIGLAPTTLLMASNYSYDPWHICLVSYSFCWYVSCLQDDKPITLRDTLAMSISFFLGAIVKGVIFPLALLFLFIPKERFASRRDRTTHIIVVLTTALLLLVTFALPFMFELGSGEVVGDTRGGSDVNSGQQIAYILAHPIQTLLMGVWFTLRMFNPAILGAGVGPSDENLLYYSPYIQPTSAPLNELVALAEFSLLIIVALLDRAYVDGKYGAIKYKLASLFLSAISFALMAGALYVSFTGVGRDTISGVQYRYLLPLLAPVMLLVFNTKLRDYIDGQLPVLGFFLLEYGLLFLVLSNSFVIAF